MDQEPVELREALTQMQTALGLIDAAGTAGDAGAHLDLAIGRLTDLLSGVGASGGVPQGPVGVRLFS